jgi:hypothetical protein
MAIRLHATVIGGLNGAALPWTINLQFGATANLDSGALLAVANLVMADINASATIKAGFMTARRITAIRLAMHNPDSGPETSAATSSAAAVAGTVTGTPPPPQVAVVVTLRSATPGRSFRGRVYLPAQVIAQDGVVASGQQTSLNAALQGIVDAIEVRCAAAGSNLAWYVWSPTRSAGAAITQVSVGSQCDTQRRRDRAIETYANFPVT